MDRLIAEKAAVEALLANPTIYDDKEKVQEYVREQTILSQKLQQTEEMWLEVTEALESIER